MNINTMCRRVAAMLALFLCLLVGAKADEVSNVQSLKKFVKQVEALKPATLIERRNILAKTRVFDVQLSPDGKYLSYQQTEGNEDKNRSSVWLYDINLGKQEKLFTYRALKSIYWSIDSRSLFLRTRNGIAVSRIFEDKSPILMVRLQSADKERWLGRARGYHDSFLVQLWDGKDEEFVVNRISRNGEKVEVFRRKEEFSRVLFDRYGIASFIKVTNKNKENKGEKFIYDVRNGEEQKVWTCQWDDPCLLRWFDDKNQRLLLRTNVESNFEHLAWFNLGDKAFHTIHQDPKKYADFTFGNFVYDEVNNELTTATASYYGDYLRTYGVKPFIKNHVDWLQSKLGVNNLNLQLPELVSHKQLVGEKVNWLIEYRHSGSATTKYYVYSPAQKALSQPLKQTIDIANQVNPLLADDVISPKMPVYYQARDGFKLQGYLTLPRGINIKNAPLVVYPHGGPWSRDFANFNKFEQLLTNRGYIVFKPNFRASTGFGKAYKTGTNNDFGNGTTQNDIIDGVNFLINNGVGNKNKLAIIGHSFGGFSTLAGVTFTPDMFKVGVAGAPPSFMTRSAKFYHRFEKKAQRESREYSMKTLVADWDDPKAYAESYERSPDKHVANIKVPLIMWAGKHDRRVFIVDVKDYALRAEELNKKISLLIDPKARHSPNSEVGTLAYAYLIEKSLAKYLGGKLQPIDKVKDKALYRFVSKNLAIDHNELM